MSEYREFTGKSVEEALKLAREAFGAGLDDLDFEILTPGSRGVLGMGAEPARIVAAPRAALGGAAPKREAAAATPLPTPAPRPYDDRPREDRPPRRDDRPPRRDDRPRDDRPRDDRPRDDRPREDRPREDRPVAIDRHGETTGSVLRLVAVPRTSQHRRRPRSRPLAAHSRPSERTWRRPRHRLRPLPRARRSSSS
jgi:Jag N-terminus